MSFLRHEEIYRPMSSSMRGRPQPDRPRPHRFDEFPAGYSLAGCAPAGPASALPAGGHREARKERKYNRKEGRVRTASSVLIACLTRRTSWPAPKA